MIIPKELKDQVNNTNLSHLSKEIALDICYSLFQRAFLEQYAPINKNKYLKLVKDSSYRKIIKTLIRAKIIKYDYYIPKEKARYYKLVNRYGEFINHEPKNIKLKIMKQKKQEKIKNKTKKMPKYLKAMFSEIKDLRWDFDELTRVAEAYEPTDVELAIKNKQRGSKNAYTKPEYAIKLRESMLFAIANLKAQKYNFHRDETSHRLHTNVTNMKGVLWHLVQKDLVEIDVKNSQPYFLNVLLNKIVNWRNDYTPSDTELRNSLTAYLTKFEIPDVVFKIANSNAFKMELETFETITTKGKFYEFFMTQFKLTRDEVKILMFEILFSKNTSYRKNKKIFINEFPMINQVIEAFKEENHNYLAILLQSIESFVIIDVLCKRLVQVENIIPVTKHDSIAIDPMYFDESYRIMRGTLFEQCDSVPNLGVEKISYF